MSKPKLLDEVRVLLRLRHESLSTEHTHVHRIKHYIAFHRMRHPGEMVRRRFASSSHFYQSKRLMECLRP